MKNFLLHFFIGILLLGFVLWRVDVTELARYVHRVDLLVLVLITFLLVVFHVLKTLRWQAILLAQKLSYSFAGVLKMYWSGLFLGVVTPGRLGDLIRIVYLRQDGVSAGRAMVGVVVDRCLDICILVLLLGGGLAWLAWGRSGQWAGAVVALALRRGQGRRLAGWLVPAELRRAFGVGWQDFAHDLRILPGAKKNLVKIIGFTGIAWGLYLWIVHTLIYSVGLQFSPGLTVLFFAVAAVASLLPFSVAGIGTRDVTLVGLAELVGLEAEAGVAFSFCILLLHVLTALVGAVGWTGGRRLKGQVERGSADDCIP